MAIFREVLRKKRLQMKITQKKLSEILGVKPPRVSEWERGVRTPKELTQLAIFMRIKKYKKKMTKNDKKRKG